MSYWKLNKLPLDDYIKSNLAKTSLKTVQDVIVLSPLTVMNLLDLSADQCKQFMDYLYNLCLPSKLTAYEMQEREEQEHNYITLGNDTLDTLLHGGLLSGSITEFVGPSGVGKTQWCLNITAKMVAMGTRPSAIYIDTESAVRPERMVEMMLSKYSERSSDVPEFLSRIHVFRPKTAACMKEILDSLEFVVVEKEARLVIVDSIASMAVSLSGNSIAIRSSQLSSWAAQLKALAHQLNICVIVTNQITTVSEPRPGEGSSRVESWPHPNPEFQVPEEEEVIPEHEMSVQDVTDLLPHSQDIEGGRSGGYVIPALGNTWTHCVTTRLILQYTDSSPRQVVIAKSPVSPFAALNYIITEEGISIIENNCYYSYSGPDPGQFRIRVQKGIPIDQSWVKQS